MPHRRVTELPLDRRAIEALLAATIETVEDAHQFGAMAVQRLLQNVLPALRQDEIDTVLRELFKV